MENFTGYVTFSKANDKELTGFSIDAYTGAVVSRPCGDLVLDLAGITCKQRMPILLNHDREKIVGYSEKVVKEISLKVIGVFSKTTEAAKEVKGLAAESFPWQASVGVYPLSKKKIPVGKTELVNGKMLAGPVEVWLQSEVFETSFVALGADSATSIAVFGKSQADTNATLHTQWSMMSETERAEYAGQIGIFLAYHTHYAGINVREALRNA